MKLNDLFEEQRVIEGDIALLRATTKLDYEGAFIHGNFDCSGTRVHSLIGAPSRTSGDFSCSNTKIKSLEGAPTYVGGSFRCAATKITSLKGSPNHVGGHYYCINNRLTSLGGAPKYVGESFHCYGTQIKTLYNIHKTIKYIGNRLLLPRTVKSHVLGVMLIKGLTEIEIFVGRTAQDQVQAIINKHLKGDRDIHACQEELLEAGLGAYAKL